MVYLKTHFLSACLVCLCACSQENALTVTYNENGMPFYSCNIDLIKDSITLQLSDITSNYHQVILKGGPDFDQSRVEGISVSDQQIVLLAGDTERALVYSRDGTYKFLISPKRYKIFSWSDVHIEESTENILLNAVHADFYTVYDSTGTCLHTFDKGARKKRGFYITWDSATLLCTQYAPAPEGEYGSLPEKADYYIGYFTELDGTPRKRIRNQLLYSWGVTKVHKRSYGGKKGILFDPDYANDTIYHYEVDKNQFMPVLFCYWPSYQIPPKKIEEFSTRYNPVLIDDQVSSDLLLETTRYFYLWVDSKHHRKKYHAHIVLDKQRQDAYYLHSIIDDYNKGYRVNHGKIIGFNYWKNNGLITYFDKRQRRRLVIAELQKNK